MPQRCGTLPTSRSFAAQSSPRTSERAATASSCVKSKLRLMSSRLSQDRSGSGCGVEAALGAAFDFLGAMVGYPTGKAGLQTIAEKGSAKGIHGHSWVALSFIGQGQGPTLLNHENSRKRPFGALGSTDFLGEILSRIFPGISRTRRQFSRSFPHFSTATFLRPGDCS